MNNIILFINSFLVGALMPFNLLLFVWAFYWHKNNKNPNYSIETQVNETVLYILINIGISILIFMTLSASFIKPNKTGESFVILTMLIGDFIITFFSTNLLKKEVTNPFKSLKHRPIIVTHSGKFHTDDVFSTALLQILNPNYKVIRIPSKKYIPKNAEVVYDIGDSKFDHHSTTTYHSDTNQTPYASFGLITDEFLPKILKNKSLDKNLSNKIIEKFISSLVIPIDANDNGTFSDTFDISNIINDMYVNTQPNKLNSVKKTNRNFNQAVEFAKTIINNRINSIQSKLLAEQEALQSLTLVSDNIGYLENFGPTSLISENYPNMKAIVFPSNRGGFNAITLKDKSDTNELINRITFNHILTSEPDITFVHKAGFLLSGTSKKAVINAVSKQLQLTNTQGYDSFNIL